MQGTVPHPNPDGAQHPPWLHVCMYAHRAQVGGPLWWSVILQLQHGCARVAAACRSQWRPRCCSWCRSCRLRGRSTSAAAQAAAPLPDSSGCDDAVACGRVRSSISACKSTCHKPDPQHALALALVLFAGSWSRNPPVVDTKPLSPPVKPNGHGSPACQVAPHRPGYR